MGDAAGPHGNWPSADWIGNYMTGGGRRCAPTQAADCNRQVNQTYDFELYSPSRFGNTNRPLYKPEHWDKVQELDMWTNKYDPVMTCQPLGIPRQGPPRRIDQSARTSCSSMPDGDGGGGYGEYRDHPDRRPQARTRSRRVRPSTWDTRSDVGKATRSCSTPISFNDYTG